ncbi:MAG: DUF362 domain-containing protein [Planctomycetes bacterium]|nr:DUF362 domain-containing protein [Planctomycetota bacterium]
MGSRIDRRTVLKCTVGCAGAVAGRLAELTGRPIWAAESRRSKKAPSEPVAIVRCESFQPQVLRRQFDKMFDLIGGIGKLVKNKTVTIKVNLTGMRWDPIDGLPAHETYQTHPNTVAALCAILHDAGAKRMIIVESLYWDRPLEATLQQEGWDIAAVQSAGGHRVTFEDTRRRAPFPAYSRFKVPWGGFIYPAFDLNQRYEKTDVLISLAKLKQHATAGITGAVKNFFGITPCSLYGNDAPSENPRSHRTRNFHAGKLKVPEGVPAELDHDIPSQGVHRVPHIVADIWGARPADLNIVEGVRTIRGGEGFWNKGVSVLEPKLIVAGRNGVCVDAIATAVMGFDPQAPHGHFPFPGENHLRLLASVGMGEISPDRIEVRGVPLQQAVFPFQPGKSRKG